MIPREFQRQHGHAKRRAVTAVLPAQPQEILARELHGVIPVTPQFLVHQVKRKRVIACRNGRVRGEDRACRDGLESFGWRQAVLDQFSRTLEAQKCGVTLVHVKDAWLESQCAQGAHTTDAQEQFLRHAQFVGAAARLGGAVQTIRQHAVAGRVFRGVGIHQVNRDASHTHLPDAGANLAA